VEAYIIEQELLTLPMQKIKQIKKLCKDDDETCIFLIKNRCMIYPVRPIICRTYGLPILYHEAERAFVDYCRLNFTQLPTDYEFEEQAILDLNTFYTELIQIDKKFVQHISGQSWHPNNRKSLKNILFHLELKQK
jgi:Fe-S-cluster containining protein